MCIHMHTHACSCVTIVVLKKAMNLRGSKDRNMGGVGGKRRERNDLINTFQEYERLGD